MILFLMFLLQLDFYYRLTQLNPSVGQLIKSLLENNKVLLEIPFEARPSSSVCLVKFQPSHSPVVVDPDVLDGFCEVQTPHIG